MTSQIDLFDIFQPPVPSAAEPITFDRRVAHHRLRLLPMMGHLRAIGIALLLFASAWADECVDLNDGATSDSGYFGCSNAESSTYGDIASYYGTNYCGQYDDDDFSSNDMCCDCGGGTTTCSSSDNGAVDSSSWAQSCQSYYTWTSECGLYNDDDFTSEDMCCACGGGTTDVAPPVVIAVTLTVVMACADCEWVVFSGARALVGLKEELIEVAREHAPPHSGS